MNAREKMYQLAVQYEVEQLGISSLDTLELGIHQAIKDIATFGGTHFVFKLQGETKYPLVMAELHKRICNSGFLAAIASENTINISWDYR